MRGEVTGVALRQELGCSRRSLDLHAAAIRARRAALLKIQVGRSVILKVAMRLPPLCVKVPEKEPQEVVRVNSSKFFSMAAARLRLFRERQALWRYWELFFVLGYRCGRSSLSIVVK